MQLSIDTHIVRTQVLAISGRLEAFTVSSLRDAQLRLLQEGEKHFVIDLRATSFMDSAGMAALVSLLKQARQAGGDVVLVKPLDEAAYRILTLTRFDQVFTITNTVEEAVQIF